MIHINLKDCRPFCQQPESSILSNFSMFNILLELLICIIISHIYYLNDGYFGLFHPYYLYLILPIKFFVAEIVATVRLE